MNRIPVEEFRISTGASLLFMICLIISGVMSCGKDEVQEKVATRPPVEISDEVAAERAKEIRGSVSADIDSSLVLSLWASDSLLADPVALDMDNFGNAYVTETRRRKKIEFDIRRHRDWELASISFKDVEDRRAFIRKTLTPEKGAEMDKPEDLNGDGVQDWHDLKEASEDVIKISDRTGNGQADFSQVVATGFQEEITDVAGGVLWNGDELFVGVAPDVWRMKDTNGDGVMDERESIAHGFQVHIGFGGHNLSGLIMGPDGRIYWGIGDIGFNGVDQDGKEWSYPNEGVIARCNPDGSDFEVYAAGLRNTHEFVFDKYGNIVSNDNDGDHPGESERLVYIVNGSDAGWRINWQFGKYNDPENNDYKVWMEEGLNLPRFEGQSAYIVPCIRNYTNGPTGMVYNPGTLLSSKWKDWYFLVEFNGNPARSGIHAFQLEQDGASLKFVRDKKILTGVLATGMDAGADGSLYFTDWIDGWELKGSGRIWKLDARENDLKAKQEETQRLLAADFSKEGEDDLGGLLGHDDMRVRQKSQFELVNRRALGTLEKGIAQTSNQLARVHAIWGVAQLIRAKKADGKVLTQLFSDTDPEIRAQAYKMLGDVKWSAAGDDLLAGLTDESPRVRFFATEALGRIEYVRAIDPIIKLLKENDDADAYLRHAGTLALARIGKVKPIAYLVDSDSKALRTAAVVALRRLRDPALAAFLRDEDEYIVTEAARAINDDLSVEQALPALGDMLKQDKFDNEALVRRAINANLRVGNSKALQNLVSFIGDPGRSQEMRLEGIMTLGGWAKPSVVDRVDGRYRGEVVRDPSEAQSIAGPVLAGLAKSKDVQIKIEALKALSKLKATNELAAIEQVLKQDGVPEVRSEALKAIVNLDPAKGKTFVQEVLKSEKPEVRVTALQLLSELNLDPAEISGSLSAILLQGSSDEQQAALSALNSLPKEEVVSQLGQLLDRLIDGKVDGPLQLDLIEVSKKNGSPILREKIEAFRTANADLGSVAEYIECLEGGNLKEGQKVLVRNSAAQCLKCHAIKGYGGVAGPALDDVSLRRDSKFILESLIDPSAHLAPGYGVVTVILNDDKTISGILESETSEALTIKNSDGESVTVKIGDVKERLNAMSSMPPMATILSKRELRDLMAFLGQLKGGELSL